MLTSTASVVSFGTRYASFWTVWIASKWLWCIFQLPEISGRRVGQPSDVAAFAQCREARQVAELQQLQRRAATGRHVVDVVVEAELGQRRRRVAAADDGERLGGGHRLGHGAGAGGEALVLEHPHRAVPEHRPRLDDRRRRTRPPSPGRCRGPWRRRAAGCRTSRTCRRRRARRCRSAGGSAWWRCASNALHVSTWSGSNSESPIGLPWAARNVKHIAPPMTSASTISSSASMTPSLSLTLAPPSTATNGRFGLVAQAEQDLDLAAAAAGPIADGTTDGGPTIEAWARCDAPNASFT